MGERIFLSEFPVERLRLVALAYRAAMAAGEGDGPARRAALAVYLADGGPDDGASEQVARMIAAVASQHSEWFWAPVKTRMAREAVRRVFGE